MGKRHSSDGNSKYKQFDDDFEDFGYEVKNIRRQTKKKVSKFKREVNEYDDTYWTGTVNPTASRFRVLYTCWRDFFMFMHRLPNGKLTMRNVQQQIEARKQTQQTYMFTPPGKLVETGAFHPHERTLNTTQVERS